MAVDLTKLALHTGYPAFHNLRVYTGAVTLSGQVSEGLNTRIFTIPLGAAPNILDVILNGPSTGLSTDRPHNGWFKEGYVEAPTSAFGSTWFITQQIVGNNLVITCVFPQQFAGTSTVTPTDINYRIVDYASSVNDTDLNKLAFDTRLNYLKRGLYGTKTITLPTSGGSNYAVIQHPYARIPFFIVGGQITSPSIIWSNNLVYQASDGTTPGGPTPPQMRYWCTTSELTIALANGFGGEEESGDRDFWYIIYLDYENS